MTDRGTMDSMTSDEDFYRGVADELNDVCGHGNYRISAIDGTCLLCTRLEDLDDHAVAGAERFAREAGLAWPPGVGDFDRYYDWRHNEGRDFHGTMKS